MKRSNYYTRPSKNYFAESKVVTLLTGLIILSLFIFSFISL